MTVLCVDYFIENSAAAILWKDILLLFDETDQSSQEIFSDIFPAARINVRREIL